MKKGIILIAAIAVAGIFSSCKKDYTCTCSTTSGSYTVSASTTLHDTKSNAKTACEKGTSTYSGVTVTCEIK